MYKSSLLDFIVNNNIKHKEPWPVLLQIEQFIYKRIKCNLTYFILEIIFNEKNWEKFRFLPAPRW